MRQVTFFLFACGLILAAEVGVRSASGEEDLTIGGRLRVSVEAVNSPLLVGEPLYLRLSWHNISEQTVPLVFRGVYQVHVGAEGQPPALLHLCREWGPSNIRRVSPINLDPGQVYVTNVWVDFVGEHDVRLLFDRAGTYRIRPEGFPADSAALVAVRDPVDPQDRQASRLWIQEAVRAWASARGLFGDTLTEAVRSSVEEILTKCPESRFAPYAAWIKITDLSKGMRVGASRHVDYPAVLKWVEFILTRHPKSPLREAVLEKAVDAYLAQDDWSRARETAEQLAREFSASLRLAGLRKTYGERFERLGPPPPPRKPVVAKTGAPAKLTMEGTEAIPEGPRETFRAFFEAGAREDGTAVQQVLAEDFMGDEGPRDQYQRSASGSWEKYNTYEIHLRIAKAEALTTYTRPFSIPMGIERTWNGRICLVEASFRVKYQNIFRGLTEERTYDRIWLALRQDAGGAWQIISQHRHSRNLIAGALGMALRGALNSNFISWRVSDGEHERHPFQEIKDRLGVADRVVDTRTEWKGTGPTMVGPKHEQVQITGNLRLLLRDEQTVPPREEWIERKVTLLLDLAPDEKSLLLKDIQVSE